MLDDENVSLGKEYSDLMRWFFGLNATPLEYIEMLRNRYPYEFEAKYITFDGGGFFGIVITHPNGIKSYGGYGRGGTKIEQLIEMALWNLMRNMKKQGVVSTKL